MCKLEEDHASDHTNIFVFTYNEVNNKNEKWKSKILLLQLNIIFNKNLFFDVILHILQWKIIHLNQIAF